MLAAFPILPLLFMPTHKTQAARRLDWERGDRVIVMVDEDEYYVATVTSIKAEGRGRGDALHIIYDEGTKEKILARSKYIVGKARIKKQRINPISETNLNKWLGETGDATYRGIEDETEKRSITKFYALLARYNSIYAKMEMKAAGLAGTLDRLGATDEDADYFADKLRFNVQSLRKVGGPSVLKSYRKRDTTPRQWKTKVRAILNSVNDIYVDLSDDADQWAIGGAARRTQNDYKLVLQRLFSLRSVLRDAMKVL